MKWVRNCMPSSVVSFPTYSTLYAQYYLNRTSTYTVYLRILSVHTRADTLSFQLLLGEEALWKCILMALVNVLVTAPWKFHDRSIKPCIGKIKISTGMIRWGYLYCTVYMYCRIPFISMYHIYGRYIIVLKCTGNAKQLLYRNPLILHWLLIYSYKLLIASSLFVIWFDHQFFHHLLILQKNK